MPPRTEIVPIAAHPGETTGQYVIEWRITNRGGTAVRLDAVVAPHGRFRSDDRPLDLVLEPGAEGDLALPVSCTAGPGADIENAFLIFTADAEGQAWRILVRMRVRSGADGIPHPTTERVDVQEVGFSEQG